MNPSYLNLLSRRFLAILGLIGIFIFMIALGSMLHPPSASANLEPILTTTPGPEYLPMVLRAYSSIPPTPTTSYILIGWNDLGMHCYNRDFRDLAVLPPYNTLWAQVIQRGDPPVIVTSGITVTYSFVDNSTSVTKTNFWDYAQQLFGVILPPNVGLAGKGITGTMDLHAGYFSAVGIPLTEYNDSSLTTRQPYQLANLIAINSLGVEIARNQVVAPVSSEMRCDNCHYDGAIDGIATGRVETNILTLHDNEEMGDYPPGHTGALMNRRPILCAECHSSNALGAPGVAGLPSLSNAMHNRHSGLVPDALVGCYNCHPGPTTLCLRDVMSQSFGKTCIDCHGGMEQVKQNPNPWLNEPRCDGCHTAAQYAQDNALYRFSKGHGGLYCEACHDSTHAIALSREPRDAIKFINLQGHTGTLDQCTVCHLTQPSSGGPHQ